MWYSIGASGSKDVVIVVDKSGSMGNAGRIGKALEATLAVLDTLTWADFANIVLFDSNARAYYPGLTQMTSANKAAMVRWVTAELFPGGGTNFRAGFEKAFASLPPNSNWCSNCNTAILFMTDGEATWTESDKDWLSANADARGCLTVFTYAFGAGVSGTSAANLKDMACSNDGIYHEIADGGNLNSVMASYFQYFASGLAQSDPEVRFVQYADALTGQELLAGCVAAFDRTLSPASLIGVTCMDVNMIVDIDTLKAQSSWNKFAARVVSDTTKCTPVNLAYPGLEELRRRVDPSNSMCGSNYGNPSGNLYGAARTCAATSCPAIGSESGFSSQPATSADSDCKCCNDAATQRHTANDNNNVQSNTFSPSAEMTAGAEAISAGHREGATLATFIGICVLRFFG